MTSTISTVRLSCLFALMLNNFRCPSQLQQTILLPTPCADTYASSGRSISIRKTSRPTCR